MPPNGHALKTKPFAQPSVLVMSAPSLHHSKIPQAEPFARDISANAGTLRASFWSGCSASHSLCGLTQDGEFQNSLVWYLEPLKF